MKQDFYSNVKDGRLQKMVSQEIANALLRHEGKRVHITIDKVSSKRSAQQNRYIHFLFKMFADELNKLGNEFTAEEVKEMCKAKFSMKDVVNEETGEVIGQRPKGTSEMGKLELNEFFESIIRWASEFFNIYLPYPGEQLEVELVPEQ